MPRAGPQNWARVMSDAKGNLVSSQISLLIYISNNRRQASPKGKPDITKERVLWPGSSGLLNLNNDSSRVILYNKMVSLQNYPSINNTGHPRAQWPRLSAQWDDGLSTLMTPIPIPRPWTKLAHPHPLYSRFREPLNSSLYKSLYTQSIYDFGIILSCIIRKAVGEKSFWNTNPRDLLGISEFHHESFIKKEYRWNSIFRGSK